MIVTTNLKTLSQWIMKYCYLNFTTMAFEVYHDLNQAIKFCKVHHFADDTNLLYLGKSIKKLNKLFNFDLQICYTCSVQTKFHLMLKKLNW